MARRTIELSELKGLVGHELGVSESIPVTQERIAQFAETTGDHQWIHLDVERAKRESPFGTTIGHGFLTLSLLSSLTSRTLEVRGVRLAVNYGLDRVRFPAPVPAGSSIRARIALQEVSEVSGGLQAKLLCTVECDAAAKPVCVAEWVVRYYH
jgi:acyl dehydratase